MAPEINIMSAEEYVSMAQHPELAREIDAELARIKAQTEANDRTLLRAFAFVLRSIMVGARWDDSPGGVDAIREDPILEQIHPGLRFPAFRQCIGACMLLEVSKREGASDEAA